MKRNSFTLCELVLVVAVVALFAVVFSGCGFLKSARARAQSSSCVDNLKQCGTTAQQYLGDHRNWWPCGSRDADKLVTLNGKTVSANTYTYNLYKGKYAPESLANDTDTGSFSCPYMAHRTNDPTDKSYSQVYGTQYVHNIEASGDYTCSGQGYNVVMAGWCEGYKSYTAGKAKNAAPENMSVGPGSRVLLCDNVTQVLGDKGGAMSVHLSAYDEQGVDLGKAYFVHGGIANLLTVDGHVASVDEGSFFKDYYFPFFGRETPRSYHPCAAYLEGPTYLVNDATK